MNKAFALLTGLLALLPLAGCGGGDSSSTTTPETGSKNQTFTAADATKSASLFSNIINRSAGRTRASSGSISAGNVTWYYFPAVPGVQYEIDVQPTSGDADLYVLNPDTGTFQGSDQDDLNLDADTISASQPGDLIYFGVYGYKNSNYNLTVYKNGG